MLLAGCGTQGKFASVFSKRKYTKGYFFNKAGSVETVNRKSAESVGIAKRETVRRKSKESIGITERETVNRKSEATLPLFDANQNTVASNTESSSFGGVEEARKKSLALKFVAAAMPIDTNKMHPSEGVSEKAPRYTDYGITSLIFSLVGSLAAIYLIAFSLGGGGLVVWFLGGLAILGLVGGFVFSILGEASQFEVHRKLARVILQVYTLLILVLLIALIFRL